ncbi:MAG: cytochrome C oxidase subunit I [Bacteroidetes bacterium]|jgi:hypothetical protein|nr:cytochrome C oxidase subunit I [Bacteroidota bacterium]
MFAITGDTASIKTTSYKVVLPFYIYAAVSFLVATILLLMSGNSFLGPLFQPSILAITHTMALGWATMIILGASHQLVPVLIEGKLHSEKLAWLSFVFAAIGIPLLVYAFYVFNMGAPAKWGGRFIALSVICYLINIFISMQKSKRENVHAVFIFAAVLWLLFTVLLGLALVYNFTFLNLLPYDSLHYLPVHAHTGIIGWFLLLVIGVGSRLIPMFLISKYTNPKLLWIIFWLINAALIFYFLIFYFFPERANIFIPSILILVAISLFIYYCRQAYKNRLRKQVDEQVKISLLSVVMILLPVILLLIIISLLLGKAGDEKELPLAYGFMIFFGWLTAIILGMTFKTLPFIVWNKVYRHRSSLGKTPNPKDLFSHPMFNVMSVFYLVGFVLFAAGIIISHLLLLKIGAALLILAAALYNLNVFKVITHKAIMK